MQAHNGARLKGREARVIHTVSDSLSVCLNVHKILFDFLDEFARVTLAPHVSPRGCLNSLQAHQH